MSLDADTLRKLNLPLDMRRVQKREGAGGKSLDYMASHDVIRTANAVFGYGKWGTETVSLVLLGEGQTTNKSGKVGWKVGYRATVRLTVDGCVPTDGTGYGDAVEYGDSPITAHELAVKEAESDAEKRALRKFGDQFGLILWAKPADRPAIERVARVRADRALGSVGASPDPPVNEARVSDAPTDQSAAHTAPAAEEPAGSGSSASPFVAPPGAELKPDALTPAAQFAKGTSQRKTLDKLNVMIVEGRRHGLFATADVYGWARDLDPLNVRDDAYYLAEDGKLHWADLRSEAPVWLCSQLIDRIKLEWPQLDKAAA